jgi:hypothetical protein
MVAILALWVITDAVGVIHSVEVHGRSPPDQELPPSSTGRSYAALLVSAVIVVLQIVITVIAAAVPQRVRRALGGIELTISEDESAL